MGLLDRFKNWALERRIESLSQSGFKVVPAAGDGAQSRADALKELVILPGSDGWRKEGEIVNDEYGAVQSYDKNSVVFACISQLALSFVEAPLKVYDKQDQVLAGHDMERLLEQPNSEMDGADFGLHCMTYAAFGGACYVHKRRSGDGRLQELMPYSTFDMKPIVVRQNRQRWVDHYRFRRADGSYQDVPIEDVIPFRWPAANPLAPGMPYSPLRALLMHARTDTEIDRYIYTLLKNDAITRIALVLPPEEGGDEEQAETIRKAWREKYGGDNRGDVAVLTGGVKVERLSLNLDELSTDVLHDVPESRICMVLRVPPEIIGVNVGLKNSTYSNKEGARKWFVENTISAFWRISASTFTRHLRSEYRDGQRLGLKVMHDTSRVVSLQPNKKELWDTAIAGYDKGLTTKNEARRMVNLQDVHDGDAFKPTKEPLVQVHQP